MRRDYFHELPNGLFLRTRSKSIYFFRIPKLLFSDERFIGLSSGAKVLYGLMLGRVGLSVKNGWIDEKNHVYIYFTLEEVMEYMRIGKDKGVKLFAELDDEKGCGFVGDIDDIPIPKEYMEPPKEERRLFKFPDKKKKPSPKDEFTDAKFFSEPQGHFTIGVFNAARGAGATWTAGNLARYLAMHNYKTCIADMSSTGAVRMMKLKNIDIYADDFNIEDLKPKYNVTVIDFGTPIEVSPDGANFKLMSHYKPETIQSFNDCDIKLIMGFSDPWNIQKINFFFINDTWKSLFDNSYLFIIACNPERTKKLFPEGNFYSREDNYREHILEALRKDEDK